MIFSPTDSISRAWPPSSRWRRVTRRMALDTREGILTRRFMFDFFSGQDLEDSNYVEGENL